MMIETERLIVRHFLPTDAADLYEYLSVKEVYEFEPGSPLSPKEAQECAIERSIGTDFYAVLLKETGKMIGHLYFTRIEPIEFRTWELGYIFNPLYQRQGLASEAAKALTEYTSKTMNIHRIMARCNTANISSWKLLEKIGFSREGNFRRYGFIHRDEQGVPIWNDVYEYSIVFEENE